MRPFHVHVSVDDIAQSIRFYSTLCAAPGVDPIGFQVDSAAELAGLKVQLHAADAAVLEEAGTSCCDAKSDKYWVTDPSGIDWRTFHTPGCILT